MSFQILVFLSSPVSYRPPTVLCFGFPLSMKIDEEEIDVINTVHSKKTGSTSLTLDNVYPFSPNYSLNKRIILFFYNSSSFGESSVILVWRRYSKFYNKQFHTYHQPYVFSSTLTTLSIPIKQNTLGVPKP